MPGRVSAWTARAVNVLADGEWHDGAALLREAEKLIPPGVAFRRAERHRRRPGSANPGPVERQHELSMPAQIGVGKRAILREMVHGQQGVNWEIDPWPIAKSSWRTPGAWRVRDLNHHRWTVVQAAKHYGLTTRTIRALVLQDPPLRHHALARKLSIYDLAGLEERVEAYRAGASVRRHLGAMASVATKQAALPREEMTLTEAAHLAHMSIANARQVAELNPQLKWRRAGRHMYMPPEQVGAWMEAVEKWRGQSGERRSKAMIAAKARWRERRTSD